MTLSLKPTSARLFRANLHGVQRDADQLFFWLLIGQWLFAVVLAITVSPFAWAGRERSLHLHVQLAVLMGGALNALPLLLIRKQPGSALTRQVVAVAQMLWSALLIDLTGGRIETHFHVFGSLAFLAFYRDIGVLLTATAVVALDHLVRGIYWPEAVYGISSPEYWRTLEHATWVIFETVVLTFGTVRARRDMVLLAEREAALEQTHAMVEHQVALRTRELGESLDRYRALVENTNAIPFELEQGTARILYIAPQATRFFGCSVEQLEGQAFTDMVHADDRERLATYMSAALAGKALDGDSVDYRVVTGDKRLIYVRTTLSECQGGSLRGLTIDISRQIKLEGELRQAQKLESIGKLAAGVAHEINTPVQFVSDSIHFAKGASEELFTLLGHYQRAQEARLAGGSDLTELKRAEQLSADIGLPYLSQQMPRSLDLALEGLGRVTTIVKSMREFAHPQTVEMASANLNQAIQSTLNIAYGEYKYVADLETDFGELPLVRCHLGDINQVVLNIVVNGAHAIAAKHVDQKGKISVRTYCEGEHVVIAIRDTGEGIPEHLRDRIFDPFFTTKDVGSGTGQGLAIARTVVVDRHAGALWFDSQLGVGTTFYIRLPISGDTRLERSAA